MIVAGQWLPIVVATRPVDFRCGHQALALIVQNELKLDPHSGVTVIFRSKRGDRVSLCTSFVRILVASWKGCQLHQELAEDDERRFPATLSGPLRFPAR